MTLEQALKKREVEKKLDNEDTFISAERRSPIGDIVARKKSGDKEIEIELYAYPYSETNYYPGNIIRIDRDHIEVVGKDDWVIRDV